MKKIKNNILLLLQFFTVFCLSYLILYRFRMRVPKDIFLDPTMYTFIIYSIILITNILIFILYFLEYINYGIKVNRNSMISKLSAKIKTWIEDSYGKLMTIIAELPGIFSIAIAYITHYYTKIPIIILRCLKYLPRVLLCIIIFYDVFYLNKFQYSYIMIYALLLTIISKAILYISIEVDKRLLQEIYVSIEMINPEQTINNYYDENVTMIKVNEFQLTNYNKEFETIEHALSINHIVVNELKLLENIQNKLETPIWFTLVIRGFYIVVFGYIVINYPIWF